MGYALFAQRKIVLTAQLNSAQLQQTQRSNEQYALATQSLNWEQAKASYEASQAGEMANLYGSLQGVKDEGKRQEINDKIKAKEYEHKQQLDAINREIYQVSVQEKAIELVVKRLDTMVTALQKQLEAVQDAEGQNIDRATPKYKGLG